MPLIWLAILLHIWCACGADVNLARGKPAEQSSTYDTANNPGKYNASKAVNGNLSDFSHTNVTVDQWWKVDLEKSHHIAEIVLYNRKSTSDCGTGNECADRLQKVYILTSIDPHRNQPNPDSSHWQVIWYRKEAVGEMINITLAQDVLAHYVAVFSKHSEGVTLKEVLIYENSRPTNIAFEKEVNQSSQYGGHEAKRAVNGNLTDFSHTNVTANQWWTVDLAASYHITHITLYNRDDKCGKNSTDCAKRLRRIYILTSTDPKNNVPNPRNGSHWQVRWYQEKAFGLVENIILEQDMPAQHVAVFSEHNEGVALREVKIYANNNLAFSKHVKHLGQYEGYPVENSVNGVLYGRYEFAHSEANNMNTQAWWRVDLGEIKDVKQIELFNRNDHGDRLHNMTILISENNPQSVPSSISSDWTKAYYEEDEMAAVGIVTFNESKKARSVALVTNDDENIIHLKEIQIFSYKRVDYALGQTATQSSTSANSSLATDGIPQTFSQTNNSASKQWWKVDIGKPIIFQYAKIYPHEHMNPSKEVTFLTNHNATDMDPVDGSGGWKKCSHNAKELGRKYILVCEWNRSPYTRQLALSVDGERGIALYTVEIYGYDHQPTFRRDSSFKREESNYTSLKISFDKWYINSTMMPWVFNALPTISNGSFKYRVVTAGLEPIVIDNLGDGRVQFTQTDLRPGRMYRFDVSCFFSGDQPCPGPSFSILSTTQACTAPVLKKSPEYLDESYTDSNGWGRRRITLKEAKCQSQAVDWKCIYQGEIKIRPCDESVYRSNNTVEDLDALTEYCFNISATNSEGLTSTKKIQITTGELRPTGKPGMKLKFEREGCVTIELMAPSERNGTIRKYEIACKYVLTNENITSNREVFSRGKDLTNEEICDLRSASEIVCNSTAVNGEGPSPPASDEGFTNVKVIESFKPELKSTSQKHMTVSILLKSVMLDNVDISSYLVIINRKGGSLRPKRSVTCDTPTKLYNYTEALKSQSSCYVAAELNSTEFKKGGEYLFVVGDGMKGKKYTNAKLQHSGNYELHQAVKFYRMGSNEEVIQFDENLVLGFSVSKPSSSTTDSGDITGPIVGGSVAALVVIVMLAGVFIYYRRRKRATLRKHTIYENVSDPPQAPERPFTLGAEMSDEAAEEETVFTSPHEDSAQPGAPNQLLEEDKGMYANIESFWVRIADLSNYISESQQSIVEQYEILEKLPLPVITIAHLPENKGKSRYKGLYPGDVNRVKLRRDDKISATATDYINASFIQGYQRDNQYIASQGPTRAIMDDFWLMVWEQKPSAIVMVTNIVESGHKKCEQYWPNNNDEVMRFGDIDVQLLSEEVRADYVIRTLKVTRVNVTRTVKHYNYMTWPDHDVPDDMGPFVSFCLKIKAATARIVSSPLLVHCSAGVGRTGTYISMDYLLDQARDKGMVDFFSYVRELRQRRPCMVQTLIQYKFLHESVLESIMTQGYTCAPAFLENKLNSYGSKHDVISEEFQHIEKRVRLASFDFSLGKTPENRDKNKFSEIVPTKKYSVYLRGKKGIYINAVLVDAFREKNQWIATQLPLSSTVDDFWQLVADEGMKVIVQLESSQVPFYPRKDNEDIDTGTFRVSRVKTESTDAITTIHMQLSENNKVTKIELILVEDWSSGLPSTQAVLSLQQALDKAQQQTGNKKICVTCSNGSSSCGLFICAYNVIEKLKAEQEADVYNAVLMAKHRRPQFISSLDKYVFLYHVLADYINEFSEYANFK